jgi:hypothetical protein
VATRADGLGIEVLERGGVDEEVDVALARAQRGLGERVDAAALERLLHLGVGSERCGAHLEEEVGTHVGRGGCPHAVDVVGVNDVVAFSPLRPSVSPPGLDDSVSWTVRGSSRTVWVSVRPPASVAVRRSSRCDG